VEFSFHARRMAASRQTPKATRGFAAP